MAMFPPFRIKLFAAAALLSLLGPLALSQWTPDLAGWQSGHGHMSTSGFVLEHDHPYDDQDSDESQDSDQRGESESSLVFTFADDGPLGIPVHPPAPAILLVPGIGRAAQLLDSHEYAAPDASVPVPPPRA